MTTFGAALRLCGLSQREAADLFDVRIDTVKSWSAGRNQPPAGVWAMLAQLWARMETLADNAPVDLDDPHSWLNLSVDDAADPLPDGATEAVGAMAILISLYDPG